jgi:hypothetical protein
MDSSSNLAISSACVDITIVSMNPDTRGHSLHQHRMDYTPTIGVHGNSSEAERVAVRLHNRADQPVAVILSVNGANPRTGEAARHCPRTESYTLEPHQTLTLDRWETDQADTAFVLDAGAKPTFGATPGFIGGSGSIAATVYRIDFNAYRPKDWYRRPLVPSTTPRGEGRPAPGGRTSYALLGTETIRYISWDDLLNQLDPDGSHTTTASEETTSVANAEHVGTTAVATLNRPRKEFKRTN